ncbi:MAG: hypothetical protein AAFQ99_13805, partial [Pseudomonadota bacterium]
MKKVLLASTALVVSAGIASADVSLSGSAIPAEATSSVLARRTFFISFSLVFKGVPQFGYTKLSMRCS